MRNNATILMAAVVLFGLAMPTSAVSLNDDRYDEYLLYDWDNTEWDVIILPPASAYAARDMTNLRAGVEAWDAGIQSLGASWLKAGLKINAYVVGEDIIPPAVLLDPEIFIVSAEFNPALLFGIGLASPLWYCLDSLLMADTIASDHVHDSAWRHFVTDCDTGGDMCFVVNTNFALHDNEVIGVTNTARRMYDLNTHEFGHCLGIGHVGDALDFTSAVFPQEDIMSYQYNSSQVHCVSSLNILALEALYDNDLRLPAFHDSLTQGDYVDMAQGSYTQVSCSNPTNNLLG